jgi:hypothetical protein
MTVNGSNAVTKFGLPDLTSLAAPQIVKAIWGFQLLSLMSF